MQLNIYKISHPIITIISNKINKSKCKSNYDFHYRYIGLLIAYEIFRKYIKTKEIYIKKTKDIKNISITEFTNKNLILTNISENYSMITDIKIVLPTIEILDINYNEINKINQSIKNIQTEREKTNIFIIEKYTSNERIIDLINELKNIKSLLINQIIIGSIESNHSILNKLGSCFPEIKVYTTKIIN